LIAAEQMLAEEARQRGLPVEVVRRERQALYREAGKSRAF
jgi:hypothetical protein